MTTGKYRLLYLSLCASLIVSLLIPGQEATAAEPVTFKVMTYNIHHGERLDGVIDLGGQARYMLSTGADIIGLQEVDVGTARTSRVDQAAFLATATGYNHVFTSHFDYQGGEYGLALLSRYPIVAHESYPLPTAGDAEAKSLLKATVDVKGELIDIYVVHFEVRNASVRNLQTAAVGEIIQQGTNPAILMGDFNALPDSNATLPWRSHLLDSYAAARFLAPAHLMEADAPKERTYTGGGATWPVIEPQNRGDAIWHGYQLQPVGTVEAPLVEWSDHRPVIATFQLTPEPRPQAAEIPEVWKATDQVAVLVSEPSREWLARSGVEAETLVDTLTDWFAEAGMTTTMVGRVENAAPGSLILLPGGRFLDQAELEALYGHVEAGGGLIAWGDAGVESPDGTIVALEFGRLLGFEYLGWSYGYPTRDAILIEPDAADWPEGMPQRASFWQFEGPAVRVLPGAKQLGTWLTRSGELAYRDAMGAAIVQNGRTAYIGATPFHPIDRNNPEMRALVTGLVRYLSAARD